MSGEANLDSTYTWEWQVTVASMAFFALSFEEKWMMCAARISTSWIEVDVNLVWLGYGVA